MNKWIIALVGLLIVLLILAAIGYFTGNWDEDEAMRPGYSMASAETVSELCMDPEQKERIRKLMTEALDLALKQKIEDLFAVWLRDPTGQPARAVKGMEIALRAYTGAWGAAMKFDPPVCAH